VRSSPSASSSSAATCRRAPAGGRLLFGKLIRNASERRDITQIAIGYVIGAVLMI
jgi:hypothetical protein